MTIYDCTVTNSNATVLKHNVTDTKDPLYKVYKGYHPGVDLKCDKVYSQFPGQVAYVGQDLGNYCVAVMYNVSNYFMYKHLKSVNVSEGDRVDTSQLLGVANKYVHVDYLTLVTSKWPVRIYNSTYYKHDPTTILTEGYESLINYYSMLMNSKDELVNDGPTYIVADNTHPHIELTP